MLGISLWLTNIIGIFLFAAIGDIDKASGKLSPVTTAISVVWPNCSAIFMHVSYLSCPNILVTVTPEAVSCFSTFDEILPVPPITIIFFTFSFWIALNISLGMELALDKSIGASYFLASGAALIASGKFSPLAKTA